MTDTSDLIVSLTCNTKRIEKAVKRAIKTSDRARAAIRELQYAIADFEVSLVSAPLRIRKIEPNSDGTRPFLAKTN